MNEQVLEWLNENELRGYPLTSDSQQFFTVSVTDYDLYKIIVDAQFIVNNNTDSLSLTSIVTDSSNLTINIPGQSAFTITNYTTTTYPQYIRNSNNNLIVIGCAAKSIPINQTINITATFEPGIILEILPSTLGVSSLLINSTPFSGSVNLIEGYQLSLIPGDQSLDIEVGRNEGNPLPCISVKGLTNDCNSVVTWVNGATPLKSGYPIKFIAGPHVNIFEDPDNNQIFIGLDFTTDDVKSTTLIQPTPLI
jgi:hypothetical protein